MILYFIVREGIGACADRLQGQFSVIIGSGRNDGLDHVGQEADIRRIEVDGDLIAVNAVILDIIKAVDLAFDGKVDGVGDIFHGHFLTVMEFHAVTEGKGISGIAVPGNFAGHSGQELRTVLIDLDQAFINVVVNALGVRGRGCERIKIVDFGRQTVNKGPSFSGARGRFAASRGLPAACRQ